MKSSIWIWAVSALVVLTLPFNPLLNRPPLAIIVFVVTTAVCLFALDRFMRRDMLPSEPTEGQQ